MEPEHKNNLNSALLMEDSKPHQKFMSVYLQQLGYEVDLADEGHKVLKMVQEKQYDLILADVRIKGLSGDEVIPLIRRKNKSKNADSLIIVWSAFVNKKNEAKFLAWGADGALPKDCKLDDLKIAIDECSKFQRSQREFRHRAKNIEQEWIDAGGPREFLKELSNLNKNQFSTLLDLLETIMEYEQWDDLSRSAVRTSQVTAEDPNP